MPNVSLLTTLTTRYFIYQFLEHMYLFCVFQIEERTKFDRFVDLNILGAARLVHSDLRIYRISFFLLDLNIETGEFEGEINNKIVILAYALAVKDVGLSIFYSPGIRGCLSETQLQVGIFFSNLAL